MNRTLARALRLTVMGLPVSGLLVAGLPLLAVRVASLRAADRLARAVAAELVAFAPGEVRPSELTATAAPTDEPPAIAAPIGTPAGTNVRQPRQSMRSPRSFAAHGVFISSAQVLALAARRAMPHAQPVQATAQHPAGLLLRGVSGWGVGLEDGDVLTEAAGQKASSVALVVGVVLSARGRQVPAISGRFFRGGMPFALTVEQPYPKEPVPG